jgi:hypothetical protein
MSLVNDAVPLVADDEWWLDVERQGWEVEKVIRRKKIFR